MAGSSATIRTFRLADLFATKTRQEACSAPELWTFWSRFLKFTLTSPSQVCPTLTDAGPALKTSVRLHSINRSPDPLAFPGKIAPHRSMLIGLGKQANVTLVLPSWLHAHTCQARSPEGQFRPRDFPARSLGTPLRWADLIHSEGRSILGAAILPCHLDERSEGSLHYFHPNAGMLLPLRRISMTIADFSAIRRRLWNANTRLRW